MLSVSLLSAFIESSLVTLRFDMPRVVILSVVMLMLSVVMLPVVKNNLVKL
jgi:hypothetical protein